MIYDGLVFHNVEAVNTVEGKKGIRIQRIPEDVRKALNEGAQDMYLSPVANVEIRFKLIGDQATIVLSTEGDATLKMFVTWGDMMNRGYVEITNEPKAITITKNARYSKLSPEYVSDTGYAYDLVRLAFAGLGNQPLYYHGMIDTDYETPTAEDFPDKRLLIYGTSITHGVGLTGPHLTYPFQAAKALEMDLINLGSSGSAFCEHEISDYIARRKDWDIAVLSVSVNMYNREFISYNLFEERVNYMIQSIASANPEKPIYCITMYPFFDDVGIYNDVSERNAEGYRQALRDAATNSGFKNVFVLEGNDLLTDFSLLDTDLLHPNDLGMIQIGKNLANRILADQ